MDYQSGAKRRQRQPIEKISIKLEIPSLRILKTGRTCPAKSSVKLNVLVTPQRYNFIRIIKIFQSFFDFILEFWEIGLSLYR